MVVWQEGGGGGSCKVQILLEDGWKACQLGCTRQTICAPGKSKEYFPIVIQKSTCTKAPDSYTPTCKFCQEKYYTHYICTLMYLFKCSILYSGKYSHIPSIEELAVQWMDMINSTYSYIILIHLQILKYTLHFVLSEIHIL